MNRKRALISACAASGLVGLLVACSSEPSQAEVAKGATVSLAIQNASGTKLGSCSGVLIGPGVVLTAGHCVAVDGVTSWDVVLNDGSARSRATSGVTYDWQAYKSKLSHPTRHDVGVIYLDTPIELSHYPKIESSVQPGTGASRSAVLDGALSVNDGALEKEVGFPLYHKLGSGAAAMTGGPAFNENGVVGVVHGTGAATGNLYVARLTGLSSWLSSKAQCNAGAGTPSGGSVIRSVGLLCVGSGSKSGSCGKGGGTAGTPGSTSGSNPGGTAGTPGGSAGTPGGSPGSPGGTAGTPGGTPGSGSPGTPGSGSPGTPGDGSPGSPGSGSPGSPGSGNPGSGSPGNPGSGSPGSGSPGEPGAGSPGGGNPGGNDSSCYDAGTEYGNCFGPSCNGTGTSGGTPGSGGNPGAGNPGAGNPGAGNPGAGNPGSGGTPGLSSSGTSGNPGAGNPGSGGTPGGLSSSGSAGSPGAGGTPGGTGSGAGECMGEDSLLCPDDRFECQAKAGVAELARCGGCGATIPDGVNAGGVGDTGDGRTTSGGQSSGAVIVKSGNFSGFCRDQVIHYGDWLGTGSGVGVIK